MRYGNRAARKRPADVKRVENEIADVLIYLARLCSVLGVDPIAAAASKLETNRSRKWPR